MTSKKPQVSDVRELVRKIIMVRSAFYLYPEGTENLVQSVLELLYANAEPTKSKIVDVISFVLAAVEVQKDTYRISDQVKEIMANAETKTTD